MTTDNSKYLKILTRYWGYTSFRSVQVNIIEAVSEGNDVLALLPTGGGKSITFQVPALLSEGICIVVTPLISLMRDQVDNLVRRGIKAMAIYSGMSRQEVDIALDNCIYGGFKFLYISPERIGTDIFRERVKKMNVSLIAVDEAHCISQWGYDFRPAYLKISLLRELHPAVPVLALTATATSDVAKDIQEKLQFRSAKVIRAGFERKNLTYSVESTQDKHTKLIEIIKNIPGSGIVYSRSRRKTVELSDFLNANSISCGFYHAGLSTEMRTSRQNDWMEGKIRVMAATNAFGMGIDKPDVRFVVHFDLPDNLESYFQEAGRAGRDGKISFSIVLFNNSDITKSEGLLTSRFPEPEYIKKVYQALGSFYKVPYGGGKGAQFDFNLTDFAANYSFSFMKCYYSIKALQDQGYVELSDEINSPSRIHFMVTRDDLYKFQVANAAFDSFIKLLLRTYSGVFTGYTAIDEQFLARKASTTADVVYQYLLRLSGLKLISYIPKKRSPVLIYCTERLNDRDLYFSIKEYKSKKDQFISRQSKVFQYASATNGCRSVTLLSYFGEPDPQKCGCCDLCRNPGPDQINNYQFDQIVQNVKDVLKNGKVPVSELPGLLNFPHEQSIQVIRWLLDKEIIQTDDFMMISITGD